jgi:hypothetical protein
MAACRRFILDGRTGPGSGSECRFCETEHGVEFLGFILMKEMEVEAQIVNRLLC